MTARKAWDIWVDVGGTFTDCVARDPAGGIHRAKVLSTSALRGSVHRVLDDRSLIVDSSWSGPGTLVTGFGFQPLARPPLEILHLEPRRHAASRLRTAAGSGVTRHPMRALRAPRSSRIAWNTVW